MNTLLLVAMVSLGAVLLWALIAPRSQWFLFASWSYRDRDADEPSKLAYLFYRIVAVLGIVALTATMFFTHQVDQVIKPEAPPPPPTAVERMWGTPDPVVVNRVIDPVDTPPKGLVSQPILGYQLLDGQTRQPPYAFNLAHFALNGATTENGYIGTDPQPGLVGLDTASLMIHVAGDPQCFPQAAVVHVYSKTVSIAVYYGQANPPDGSNSENLGKCSVDEDAASVSTLIPIPLVASLRDRTVVTLSGKEIPLIALISAR